VTRSPLLTGIARGAAAVACVTLLVRLLSFLREIAAAAAFGAGEELDIFFIAFLVPSFLFYSIMACAGPALIPALMQARQRGGEAAMRALTARANGVALLGFGAMAVLTMAASPFYMPVLAPHLSPQRLAQGEQWTLALSLLTPLLGISALWTAIANAEGRLALPAAVPLLSPLMSILALSGFAEAWGAGALVAGMLLGAVLEVGAMGLLLRRIGLLAPPRWPRRRFASSAPPAPAGADTEFEWTFITLFTGAAILSLIPAADQAMASQIGVGGITSMLFGGRLVALTGSVGALALGASVLPPFARLAAERDWAGLDSLMRRCAAVTLLLALLVCSAISWFSLPLTRVMFQYGAFTSEDAIAVAAVQSFYILQIPFYLGWIVLSRALGALGHNRLLLLLSVGAAGMNVVLNFFLRQSYGAPGIAAVTAVTHFLLFSAVCAAARFHLRARMRGSRQ
jgi:putative peptidoglycan lipid II flippase